MKLWTISELQISNKSTFSLVHQPDCRRDQVYEMLQFILVLCLIAGFHHNVTDLVPRSLSPLTSVWIFALNGISQYLPHIFQRVQVRRERWLSRRRNLPLT